MRQPKGVSWPENEPGAVSLLRADLPHQFPDAVELVLRARVGVHIPRRAPGAGTDLCLVGLQTGIGVAKGGERPFLTRGEAHRAQLRGSEGLIRLRRAPPRARK